MRVGLIARADATGLGIQSKELYDHVKPSKVLLIDSSDLAPLPEILKPNIDWYPGALYWKMIPGHGQRYGIPRFVIQEFIKDLDVVFCMETPYDYNVFDECRKTGVKSILQLNYEFLDFPSSLPRPDLFAAPSRWNYDLIPDRKCFLPVPVNTKPFTPKRKLRTFLHIIGRPAAHDRNGTRILMAALQHVTQDIHITFKSQMRININVLPKNVSFDLDISTKPNYWDNYDGGVLIMPRRYGGLCLPMNEAIGAEMPVIATDVSPNNMWLPEDWLVESRHTGSFQARHSIDLFEADAIKLADKIDQFCDEAFYDEAVQHAKALKDAISWDTLLPVYHKTFLEL